jgi:hypothetical protein
VSDRGGEGSRVCARHFAAKRDIPGDLRGRVRRLEDLARRLDCEDTSLFWTFDVFEYPSAADG